MSTDFRERGFYSSFTLDEYAVWCLGYPERATQVVRAAFRYLRRSAYRCVSGPQAWWSTPDVREQS
jgi:hypothetical protein